MYDGGRASCWTGGCVGVGVGVGAGDGEEGLETPPPVGAVPGEPEPYW